jgi:hypothetical protein
MTKIIFNSGYTVWEARSPFSLETMMAEAVKQGYIIAEEANSHKEGYFYDEQALLVAIPLHSIYKIVEE